jgi:CheY-like chemotaxis protein
MSAKIMVVDDSAMSRRTMRRILEGAGHSVVEAEEGMAALELYFLEKPDLVFLDLVMKGMYGLEVLEKLRGRRQRGHPEFDAHDGGVGRGARFHQQAVRRRASARRRGHGVGGRRAPS